VRHSKGLQRNLLEHIRSGDDKYGQLSRGKAGYPKLEQCELCEWASLWGGRASKVIV
jgi:hypothetical protein